MLCGLCAGCAGIPPVVGLSPRAPDSAEEQTYQTVLEHYTGRAELYGLFDTHMFAAATLQSWPFREERVRHAALFKSEPPEVVEAHRAEERAKFDESIELFMGAYLTDYHYDDFDKHDSVWRIALATNEGEVRPLSIQRVGRASYDLRGYYPYLGDYWTGYRVRFPKTFPSGAAVVGPNTTQVTLKVSSTLGQATITLPAQ